MGFMWYSNILYIIILSTVVGFLIYFINKSNKAEDSISELEEIIARYELNLPTASLESRISSSKELLSLIDNMIKLEIISARRYEIFLNKKNTNIDFDEIIKNVSNTVFTGLQTDLFGNRDALLTSDYLMKYIQEQTVIQYLMYIENTVSEEL